MAMTHPATLPEFIWVVVHFEGTVGSVQATSAALTGDTPPPTTMTPTTMVAVVALTAIAMATPRPRSLSVTFCMNGLSARPPA